MPWYIDKLAHNLVTGKLHGRGKEDPLVLGQAFQALIKGHPRRQDFLDYMTGQAAVLILNGSIPRSSFGLASKAFRVRTDADIKKSQNAVAKADRTRTRNTKIRKANEAIGKRVREILDNMVVGNRSLGDCTADDLRAEIKRQLGVKADADNRINFIKSLIPFTQDGKSLRQCGNHAALLAVLEQVVQRAA